jgi:UDP-N-acetylglucosamine--N-acetylmuramyl-(pentapeptide) pyrophosphoryl-undecaprenol N-acetylglucosamine transferase
MKRNLIFTGGGSGGHVMPALTIIKKINQYNEFEIHYIGGIQSIERDLVKNYDLTYHPIHTGKLRRYLSVENIKDVFKIFLGFFESLFILFYFSKKNTLVFSTGGFVSVPVVLAAKFLGIKVFIHEQTSRVGLANKICSVVANKVFVSFEESLKFFPQGKTFHTGYPVRDKCYLDEIAPVVINGVELNNLKKPILFVTGGGNGSALLNDLIRNNFEEIISRFVIVHQVGKNYIEEYSKIKHPDYFPLPFVGNEMIDLFKLATCTVSRSGAGTVCELLAIGKKSIFIPLKIAQKNEQYFNALEAKNKLGSIIILENELNRDIFLRSLREFDGKSMIQKLERKNSLEEIINEIQGSGSLSIK